MYKNYFKKKNLYEKSCDGNCANWGLDCFNCCKFNPWTNSCGIHKTFTVTYLK